MKNCIKDHRKLKQQQFTQPLLSLKSSSVLKPLAGVALREYKNVEKSFVKHNFRYPHKVQRNAAPEHIVQEKPIVHRITVDLRPVLREAFDLCEEDVSDIENESNSIPTPAPSDQGLNRELYSQSTSQISEQDLQREKSPSGLIEQGLKRRYVSLEEKSLIQRNLKPISFSLPSLQNCESHEEKSKLAQKGQQRVNLVEITNTGTLTFDKKEQFTITSPVSFPKIILKEFPSQKMSKEQRPSFNENTSWLGLEKMQLPISELVKVIKEQTNSEQHTLITKVLCSLREKHDITYACIHCREKDSLQHVGVLGRMYKETSQKIPQIPCGGGEIRLTWIKRN
ncbi:uncharacterized protein LOC130305772 [Hyla sarda]|uniref:uncharacterized protein LOC130305772 n=1 Tax=Hyla sarda TaxID=327740 RepID=UPI0024C25F5C|nr:uncharacterized protein LOC130305772 [Hyla sarda]